MRARGGRCGGVGATRGGSPGFVSSMRDPSDGRVRLVTRTADGDAAAAAASQAIAAIERRWRDQIGATEFDTMKQALRELGRDVLERE